MRRVAIVLLCCAGLAARAAESLRLPVLRNDGVRVELQVEVAVSSEARRVGLMGRTALAPRSGMLFDFQRSATVTMWMKNTPLSLDMLFLDAGGRIAWLRACTTPGSLELISPPAPVRYVVEIAGGEAEALGLAPGDRALLSALGRP